MALRAISGEPAPRTLVLACGALAKEILHLKSALNVDLDLQCLPAGYHNTPGKIVPGLKVLLDKHAENYDRVLIGYGDCGTGGGLDRLLENYPKAERLPGAHCYAFFAGLPEFDAMMEEELGSFFLTDYLARHFDTLIWKGMGLDRFPKLLDDYFKHYKRVVYLSQTHNEDLVARAKAAADKLGLTLECRHTAYGDLQSVMANMPAAQVREDAHV